MRYGPIVATRSFFPFRTLAALALAAVAVTGCPAPVARAPESPKPPKCALMETASRAYVVDWTDSERAAFDAARRKGIVLARYDGCTLHVLPGCNVSGSSYAFKGFSQKVERVTLLRTDDSPALAAAGVGASDLPPDSAEKVTIEARARGVFAPARWHDIAPEELREAKECEGATHAIASFTVGAFEASMSTSTPTPSATRATTSGGSLPSCAVPPPDALFADEAPKGCDSTIRVELSPLTKPFFATAWPAPIPAGYAAELPPRGDRYFCTAATQHRMPRSTCAPRTTDCASVAGAVIAPPTATDQDLGLYFYCRGFSRAYCFFPYGNPNSTDKMCALTPRDCELLRFGIQDTLKDASPPPTPPTPCLLEGDK